MRRIRKQLALPNDTVGQVHQLWNVEIGGDNRLYAIIDSFADEESTAILWRDRYIVSAIDLGEIDVPMNIVQSLVNTIEGPFYRGTVIL